MDVHYGSFGQRKQEGVTAGGKVVGTAPLEIET